MEDAGRRAARSLITRPNGTRMTDDCNCDTKAWEHCGQCLCCPNLPKTTYEAAAAAGLDASDLTRIINDAVNIGDDPNEAITAAINRHHDEAELDAWWPITNRIGHAE